VIQLAQIPKTVSEEQFTSQETAALNLNDKVVNANSDNDSQDADLGSQTFSILNSNTSLKPQLDLELEGSQKLTIISETQEFNVSTSISILIFLKYFTY
jgi:hypothetical protein